MGHGFVRCLVFGLCVWAQAWAAGLADAKSSAEVGLYPLGDCNAVLSAFQQRAADAARLRVQTNRQRWHGGRLDYEQAPLRAPTFPEPANPEAPGRTIVQGDIVDRFDILNNTYVASLPRSPLAMCVVPEYLTPLVLTQVWPAHEARQVSVLTLNSDASGVFVRYPRVIVVGSAYPAAFEHTQDSARDAAFPDIMPSSLSREAVVIHEVDISDVQKPRLVWERFMEGRLISAHLQGDAVQVVSVVDGEGPYVAAMPDLASAGLPPTANPSTPPDTIARADALFDALIQANATRLSQATLNDWLPQEMDQVQGPITRLGCHTLMAPSKHAGTAITRLTKVTWADTGQKAARMDTLGVVADCVQVHHSPNQVFIATADTCPWRWQAIGGPMDEPTPSPLPAAGATTDLHLLRGTRLAEMQYVASVNVGGLLFASGAMDEAAGHLRVVTTRWGNGNEPSAFVHRLEVFATAGAPLQKEGRSADFLPALTLSRVDFTDARALAFANYDSSAVVAMDLRDPAHPTVQAPQILSALPGALRWLDSNRFVTLAQSSDPPTQSGLALSVFEFADNAPPKRRQHTVFAGGGADSSAFFDNRALKIQTVLDSSLAYEHYIVVPMAGVSFRGNPVVNWLNEDLWLVGLGAEKFTPLKAVSHEHFGAGLALGAVPADRGFMLPIDGLSAQPLVAVSDFGVSVDSIGPRDARGVHSAEVAFDTSAFPICF